MTTTIFPIILDQNKAKLTDYIHFKSYFTQLYSTGTYTFHCQSLLSYFKNKNKNKNMGFDFI